MRPLCLAVGDGNPPSGDCAAELLDAFGAHRLLIGSDWPVCTLAGRYGDILAIVIDYIARLLQPEQDAICHLR